MAFPYKKFSNITKLGPGGIEDVFSATELSTSRKVAIKKLSSDLRKYQGNYKMFDRNVKALRSLHHDNIIRVSEYGAYENSYYMSMEYIDGYDLERLLRMPSFNTPIGLMIVFKALKGLMHAHKHGVFHCDIKPGNILVSKNGRVKLSDFGLAHVKEHLLHAAGSGSVFITPFYMPPEQASAIAEQSLDSDVWAETTTLAYKESIQDHVKTLREQTLQWDMWSVGVLLYRVLTGKLPFHGENLAQLANSIATFKTRKVHEQFPSVPADLSDLIDACLIKDPLKRLASLDPVIASLQLYILGTGAHDIEMVIQNYLLKYAQSDEETEVEDNPKTCVGESSVMLGTVVSPPTGRSKTILLAVISIAVLIVSLLSTLFFMNRLNSRSPSYVVSLQNDPGSAPIPLPSVPEERIPAETPPAPVSPPKGFKEIDSAIADIASSGIPHGPAQKIEQEKNAPADNRAVSDLPAVATPAKPPEPKRVELQATGRISKPKNGILKVMVEPYNAVVSIDGETISSYEITMGRRFSSGQHTISVSAVGFLSYQQALQIEPGATQIMSIVLKQKERGSGFLNVYSYPWSTIYIDGLMLGTTPTPSPVALAEGEHTMRLERDGFLTYKETVTIKNGEVTRIQVDLVKRGNVEQKPGEAIPAELDSAAQK